MIASWPRGKDLTTGIIYTEYVGRLSYSNDLTVHSYIDEIKDGVFSGREIYVLILSQKNGRVTEERMGLFFRRTMTKSTGLVDRCYDCRVGPSFKSLSLALIWLVQGPTGLAD